MQLIYKWRFRTKSLTSASTAWYTHHENNFIIAYHNLMFMIWELLFYSTNLSTCYWLANSNVNSSATPRNRIVLFVCLVCAETWLVWMWSGWIRLKLNTTLSVMDVSNKSKSSPFDNLFGDQNRFNPCIFQVTMNTVYHLPASLKL